MRHCHDFVRLLDPLPAMDLAGAASFLTSLCLAVACVLARVQSRFSPRLGAGGGSRCKPQVLHPEDGAAKRIDDGNGRLQFLSFYDGTEARYVRTGEIYRVHGVLPAGGRAFSCVRPVARWRWEKYKPIKKMGVYELHNGSHGSSEMLLFAALFSNMIHHRLGFQVLPNPLLHPDTIYFLSCSRTFNTSKARRLLGYQPVVSLENITWVPAGCIIGGWHCDYCQVNFRTTR